jgi:hypothetical protein
VQIKDRKGSCAPEESLDDFMPGTAAPPSPAFSLDRSLSLSEPMFAAIGEEELDMTEDEDAEPLISPRTVRETNLFDLFTFTVRFSMIWLTFFFSSVCTTARRVDRQEVIV